MLTFEKLLYKLDTQTKLRYKDSQFIQDYDPHHTKAHMCVSEVFTCLQDTESLLQGLDEDFECFRWNDSCVPYMAMCIDDFVEYMNENRNN